MIKKMAVRNEIIERVIIRWFNKYCPKTANPMAVKDT